MKTKKLKKQLSRPAKKKYLPTTAILLLAYAVVILVTALAAAFIGMSQRSESQNKRSGTESPFSIAQSKTVSFQLYYPTKLPSPLHVDPASVSFADTMIVTLRVVDGSGSLTNRSFTMSQQSTPANFNIDAFGKGIENKRDIETDLGIVTIGTINFGQTKLAIIATKEKTLIIIQADQGISQDELSEIVQHLVPSPRS